MRLHFTRLISRHYSLKSTVTNPGKKRYVFRFQQCKSMTQLKQIQAQILSLGLHQNDDMLIRLMALCTLPSWGSLVYAERIFCYIDYPCLFVYNLLIKAFAKNGSFRKCLRLFAKLRADGLSPDNFTFPFVFKSIGCLGEVLEGEKLHGFVVKTGVQFDNYVCNSLMDMYAQLGRIGISKKLFDEMPERDVVLCNVLISRYVKSRRFQDAVDVFCCMRKENKFRPDEATVVSTLSACAALKCLEIGKELHSYAVEKLELTSVICNALLEMYCQCGCLSVAWEIFEQMPSKTVISWTSMVCGYVNCGELDRARELFDDSPVKDVVLWTAMINGYVQFNRFDEAVALFREMLIRRVKPDKVILVTLLTGCAQMGALEQGKWIHEYILRNGLLVDAIVGTSLVEMYSKCGCIEKALKIFHSLREKDSASWTSVICGLAINGKTSKALELFSEMKQVGAKLDEITFIGVLTACRHGGLLEEGLEFFNSMKSFGIEPTLEHYGGLIDALGQTGQLDEAENLIKMIPDGHNEIIVPLYGSLLSACRIYGNVEMGERMAERLAKIESSNSSVHTLLANIYASANRWEDVNKVRRKMKNLGITKVPGCSSIEVDGTVHEFFVGDPCHPEMREIFFMLGRMTKLMSGSEESEIERADMVAVTP